jgi:hypothetical protein
LGGGSEASSSRDGCGFLEKLKMNSFDKKTHQMISWFLAKCILCYALLMGTLIIFKRSKLLQQEDINGVDIVICTGSILNTTPCHFGRSMITYNITAPSSNLTNVWHSPCQWFILTTVDRCHNDTLIPYGLPLSEKIITISTLMTTSGLTGLVMGLYYWSITDDLRHQLRVLRYQL